MSRLKKNKPICCYKEIQLNSRRGKLTINLINGRKKDKDYHKDTPGF